MNWINVEDRLPELGKLVYTKDDQGNVSAYTRYEQGWNSKIDTSNNAIIAWLEQ